LVRYRSDIFFVGVAVVTVVAVVVAAVIVVAVVVAVVTAVLGKISVGHKNVKNDQPFDGPNLKHAINFF
jgi:hypothetical protein